MGDTISDREDANDDKLLERFKTKNHKPKPNKTMSLKQDYKEITDNQTIPKGWETVEEISVREGLSLNYTRSILRQLVNAGKWESKRFSRRPTLHYKRTEA